MKESDKEFVTRMASTIQGISLIDWDRLSNLALRGAETQWRPIEEALKEEDALVRDCYGYIGVRRPENSPSTYFPHFIPLSALGEPK